MEVYDADGKVDVDVNEIKILPRIISCFISWQTTATIYSSSIFFGGQSEQLKFWDYFKSRCLQHDCHYLKTVYLSDSVSQQVVAV